MYKVILEILELASNVASIASGIDASHSETVSDYSRRICIQLRQMERDLVGTRSAPTFNRYVSVKSYPYGCEAISEAPEEIER